MRAKFNLQQNEPLVANVSVNQPVQMVANLKVVSTGTFEHDKLYNRDLPDQHPISAITNLQDILDKLWTFTYEQAIASDVWEIQHNLGRNPSVVIVDSSGNVFYPAVQYIDENKLIVTMNGATTGKAYLN